MHRTMHDLVAKVQSRTCRTRIERLLINYLELPPDQFVTRYEPWEILRIRGFGKRSLAELTLALHKSRYKWTQRHAENVAWARRVLHK